MSISIGLRRWLSFAVCMLPLAVLIGRTLTGRLGLDPYETLIRGTGDAAIQCLLLSLAMTPLAQMKRWKSAALAIYRKPFGLAAFTYALLHFILFMTLDVQFIWQEFIRKIAEKPYVLVGMVSFVLLLLLAITSLNRMIKALGGKRWKRLHQSVYVLSLLVLLHYFWLSKMAPWDFWLYTGITLGLLGYRVALRFKAKV